jgi:PAS domain S-box-containing protein
LLPLFIAAPGDRVEKFSSASARYRSVFDAAPQGIILFHAATGSILDANTSIVRMLGYSRDEARSFGVQAFPPFQTGQFGSRILKTFHRSADPAVYREQLIAKNGTPLECEISATAYWESRRRAVQLNVRKVEALNRGEGASVNADEWIRALPVALGDYAVLTLDADRHVTSASPATQAVLGYSEAEIGGRDIDIIYTPEDRFAGQPGKDFDAAVGLRRTAYDREYLRKDGRRFPATGVISSIGGESRRGFAIVIRDFTEHKQRESTFEWMRKVESIRLLAAGIAHRFNNLLTAILGNVTLLTGEMEGNSFERTCLENAICAVNRAAELTGNMLAYAGSGIGPLEALDFGQVVSDAASRLRPLLPDGIHLRTNVAPNLPRVKADRQQTEQVVANLVMNAAEAMPQGGAVNIRAEETFVPAEALPELVQPHTLSPGRYVCLHGGAVEVVRGRRQGSALRVFLPPCEQA